MIKGCVFGLALLAAAFPAGAANGLEALKSPRAAPAFEIPGTDGRVHRLEDYAGKYLLVNFWAVWCGPCRREMPSMQRLYESLRDEPFELLAVHVGPSLEQAASYAEQLGLSFPIAVDSDLSMSDWQVVGLPSTYLLDPEGKVVAEAIGEREWDDPVLSRELKAYLIDD